MNDFFKGKYTLNDIFVLRRAFDKYSLYNINEDYAVEINLLFYTILNYFLHNATNLSVMQAEFNRLGIDYDLHEFQTYINVRNDLPDLLVEREEPYKIPEIYNSLQMGIGVYHEYTPENIDFLITNNCNLKCPHCYREADAKNEIEKIPTQRLFEIIDELEVLRVRSVKITGGEAFVVKELYDIVSYLSKKRIHISLLTNATLPLNNEWLRLLSKPNISVGISLDGISEKTHDKIRGKGAFNKTISNIQKIKSFGVKFMLTFTINDFNRHEIKQIPALAANLGAKRLHFNIIEESGRALSRTSIFKDCKNQADRLREELESIRQSYNIPIEIVDNHRLSLNEKEKKQMEEKKDLIICKAGFASFAIDAKLAVYPCIYGIGGKIEYPIGSLLNTSVIDMWNKKDFDLFRGGIKMQDLHECRDCKVKKICQLKYCRLRPLYEGKSIYSAVSFCHRNKSC